MTGRPQTVGSDSDPFDDWIIQLKRLTRRLIEERIAQLAKWGTQSHLTLAQWYLILAEEVGEVAKDLTKIEVPPAEDPDRGARLDAAETELIQVASVALAMIQHIRNVEEER